MFERFHQKKLVQAVAESHAGKMLDQMALATAVAKVMGDYVRSRNRNVLFSYLDC